MFKQRLMRAPLAAAIGLLALIVVVPAAQATDASVQPVKVDGNPKCADYGMTALTKFDSPVKSGTQGGITLTKHDDYYVKWTSTVAVDLVIVKGGPNANVYSYPVDTFGDDWLHAPMNGGQPYGLSHVEFCSDGKVEPKPNPAIVLEKTGNASATAGSTFTYSFKATNTGNVTLSNVVLTDPKCESAITRVDPNKDDTTFGPGDSWYFTCTVTAPAGPAQVQNLAEVCGEYPPGPTKKVCDDDPHTFTVPGPNPAPAIVLEKTGAVTAVGGSTFTYSFKATNTGNVTLTDAVLTDPKCESAITRTGANAGATTFAPGDVWFYTCTMVAPQGPAQVDNTAEVCADYVPGQGPTVNVCDEDSHTYTVPPPAKPVIVLDKTGAATAAAGSTFTYSFKATNTGNVTLADVVLTDAKCASAITRVEPNLADATFDPGDSWYFTCTVTAPAGPAQVDNTAEVCADYVPGQGEPMTVCDEDTHTFTVPPPPANIPPTSTPNGTPPSGGVLPEEIVSGRAALRGPSGCVRRAFKARVTGRSIASVTFFVDGRRVKRVGRGGAFRLKVNPKRYGLGRHKIVAVVRFTAESGTKSRRLPLTFRRCAQGAVAPRFTG